MTEKEIDNNKYKVCCPLCDNIPCRKDTNLCEAEQWKKKKLKENAHKCV